MKRFRFLLVYIVGFASLGFSQQGGGTPDRSNEGDSNAIAKKEPPKPAASYSPGIALTASLLLPGAGQIYTRHYVKGALFFATEIGVGLFAYQRYIYTKGLRHNADSIADTAMFYLHSWQKAKSSDTTRTLETAYKMKKLSADSAAMEKLQMQDVFFQSVALMAGIYYWNVLDALQCTNLLKSDSKKDPATAMWLSAIPGLGLGQVYNGELSKAGMILMAQFYMAYLAINYHTVMKDCQSYEIANSSPADSITYVLFNGTDYNKWDYWRTTAFKNRNMWIWYSVAFYLYGIMDAAVDAHLHDARIKMRLEPDLVPQNKEIGLHATLNF